MSFNAQISQITGMANSTSRGTPSETERKRLEVGDLIEVMTVDRALGGNAYADRRRKPIRRERWRGVVLGPSLMGPGWWIVKKLNGAASRGRRTYTVPKNEIVRVLLPKLTEAEIRGWHGKAVPIHSRPNTATYEAKGH